MTEATCLRMTTALEAVAVAAISPDKYVDIFHDTAAFLAKGNSGYQHLFKELEVVKETVR